MLGLHVAKFMGNGERRAESVVLADAAAPVRVAHRPQLSKAWGVHKKKKWITC